MLRARTATLTREGRDTLWLLLALTLSLAPHLGRLPLWCSIGTALALLWRARLAWSDAPSAAPLGAVHQPGGQRGPDSVNPPAASSGERPASPW